MTPPTADWLRTPWGWAIALAATVFSMVAYTSPAAVGDPVNLCGWRATVTGDPARLLYVDEAALYVSAWVPMSVTNHVELAGMFPHARYQAFTTYDGQLRTIDHLHDTDIVPDHGSTNPFVLGGDRTAAQRSYKLKVVDEAMPGEGREPNTLYLANADGSRSSSGGANLTMRIYAGDLGTDKLGGVPLPQITLVSADGERTTLPECPDVAPPDTGIWEPVAAAGLGTRLPQSGLASDSNPPVWTKFVPNGLGENADNSYVYTTYSPDHGQVLAFRAKAPTFPATRNGEPRMGKGQVRYWSFCSNLRTTQFLRCAQDYEIPVDRHGYYTIVVSREAARPRNATQACGVAWLPAGPSTQAVLVLRNLLPAASFAQAIQQSDPGTEEPTMGAFHPRGRYFDTTQDYERLGCES